MMSNDSKKTTHDVCKAEQNQEGLGPYVVPEPPAWDADTFFSRGNPIKKDKEWIEQRISDLKNEVRVMLKSTTDKVEKLQLVDTLEHLGLGYQFKKEINDALRLLHDAGIDHNGDLYNVATRFRILRQHGFDVSSDELDIFKDGEGNFDEKLKNDPKGLLSLYNAGYVAVPGEEILTDAISLAKGHLTSMVSCLKFPLKNQVLRALKTPLHRMMTRVEARYYIEEYEAEERRNAMLLELAKLDFNLVQSLHLEEIKNLFLWWKELNACENLKYARNRLAECYTFWVMGVYFEPELSRARTMCTKLIALGTLVDDTFDVHGIYEDCKLLNDAIQRWDEKAVDSLPVLLQPLFVKFINAVNSIEDELEPNERFRFPFLVESIQIYVNGCMQEVEWSTAKHVPTYDERKIPAFDGNAYCWGAMAPFIGMPAEIITKDIFQWLATVPSVVQDCIGICRYLNDITSFERETMAGEGPTSIECYRIENDLTEEEAMVKFQSFSDEAWKRLNQACFPPTNCPVPVFERLVNYGRMVETMYVYCNDSVTDQSSNLKEIIALLLLKPFSL